MKHSKFPEEQVSRILKEVEAGAKEARPFANAAPANDASDLEIEVCWNGGVEVAAHEGCRARAGSAQARGLGGGASRAQGRALAKWSSEARRLELSLAMQTDPGLSARRTDRVLALSRYARRWRSLRVIWNHNENGSSELESKQ